MYKRLRKKLKVNLDPVIISDENDIPALKELAKECLDYVLISSESDLDDLKELESMMEEDLLNSLLIEENLNPIILEDVDPLELTNEFYPKAKTKPITTNKNWYI